MVKYLLLLSLSITSAFGVPVTNNPSLYIIGGRDAEPGEFPHQVSIQVQTTDKFIHHCGGSIISPLWILTAAHCVEHPISNYQIVAGVTQLSNTNLVRQERKIAELVIHPKYDEASYAILNDIALIKLDKPLEFNERVQAIHLPKSGLQSHGKVVAIGWGTTDIEMIQYSNTLKMITVNILSTSVCKSLVSHLFKSETHICTGSKSIEGVCFGDSGGPLIQNGQIIGVASFVSPECGKTAVYATISSYIDFIEQCMNN